jgi:hypothetical protein
MQMAGVRVERGYRSEPRSDEAERAGGRADFANQFVRCST